MPALTAARFLVSGRVQGVNYRWTTTQVARRLGLDGWARNLPDGRVEVFAQGGPEAIEALAEFLRTGPPHASVTGVERMFAAVEPLLDGFVPL